MLRYQCAGSNFPLVSSEGENSHERAASHERCERQKAPIAGWTDEAPHDHEEGGGEERQDGPGRQSWPSEPAEVETHDAGQLASFSELAVA
jgi:hypothetical protein